jgi:aspartate carbamoyltransferase catalytic subunit
MFGIGFYNDGAPMALGLNMFYTNNTRNRRGFGFAWAHLDTNTVGMQIHGSTDVAGETPATATGTGRAPQSRVKG